MLCLTIRNDVAEMAALEPFVEQMGEAFDLDMGMTFQLQLALDEAVANVVNYAYGDRKDMPVTIEAEKVEEDGRPQLVVRLIDAGEPFDPLAEAPDVDTTLSAEERPIGGLGIFLIRQTMDVLQYRREEDQNILTMVKYLAQ